MIPLATQVSQAAAAYAVWRAERRGGRLSPELERHALAMLRAFADSPAPLALADIHERELIPVSRPRLNAIVAVLLQRGHVEVTHQTAGRGRRYYVITPAGRDALGQSTRQKGDSFDA